MFGLHQRGRKERQNIDISRRSADVGGRQRRKKQIQYKWILLIFPPLSIGIQIIINQSSMYELINDQDSLYQLEIVEHQSYESLEKSSDFVNEEVKEEEEDDVEGGPHQVKKSQIFHNFSAEQNVSVIPEHENMLIDEKIEYDKRDRRRKSKYEMIPSCNAQCLLSMGKNGYWEQDWKFAKEYGQFPLPWVIPAQGLVKDHEMKFLPDADAPFPWRTSWKWNDDKCQVSPMTHENLCHVLAELGIDRIAFYGDSLTELQYQSFVNMMGTEHTRQIESTTNRDVHDKIALVCPEFSSTKSAAVAELDENANITIPIFFRRPINEDAYKQEKAIYEIAEELHSFIHQSNQRLLGIFNIGAHYLEYDIYHDDIKNVLEAISALNRSQDLYFFRTTSPGHDQCQPRNPREFNWTKGTRDVPFKSINELKLHTGKPLKWSWDKFQFYNQYTKEIIKARQRSGDIPMIHVLDVYNMTALRHDGHRGGVDCLHYGTPGPVDWWNNLLVSYLKKLGMALQQTNSVNCSPW